MSAIWIPCPEECGNYWCLIHDQHAHECDCPGVNEGFNPYE